MEESETLISEREIPRLLAEYQVYAVNCIQNEQMQQGFDILMRSQELIEAAITQDAAISSELVILTEHTMAFYFYKIGDFANQARSIERTIDLFKNYLKSLPRSFLLKPSNRIFKARILLKLYLQLLTAQSQLGMFQEALASSKEAVKRSQSIVHNTLKACQDHLARHKLISSSPVMHNKVKNQQYILLESPHYQLFHSLVLKSIQILLYLDEKTTFSPRIIIPSLSNQNIDDLIEIQPWTFETLIKGPEIMEELERDLMIEKILFHISSHFLLGSLLKQGHTQESQIEAKIVLKRAFDIAKCYLPPDNKVFLSVAKNRKRSNLNVVNRVRSSSRIKVPGKSDGRSASTNKFRKTPSKKLTETYKEVSSKGENSLVPLRRKIIGKFEKFKLK